MRAKKAKMLDYPFLRDVAFAVVLLYASRRYWPTSASAVHAAVLIHSLLSSYWLRRVNRAVNLPYLVSRCLPRGRTDQACRPD